MIASNIFPTFNPSCAHALPPPTPDPPLRVRQVLRHRREGERMALRGRSVSVAPVWLARTRTLVPRSPTRGGTVARASSAAPTAGCFCNLTRWVISPACQSPGLPQLPHPPPCIPIFPSRHLPTLHNAIPTHKHARPAQHIQIRSLGNTFKSGRQSTSPSKRQSSSTATPSGGPKAAKARPLTAKLGRLAPDLRANKVNNMGGAKSKTTASGTLKRKRVSAVPGPRALGGGLVVRLS